MNVDTAATALREDRAKLVRQLAEFGADSSGDLTGEVDYGEGFADAAAATSERSEVIGLVVSLVERLKDVDAALAKVDAGTYGTCEVCGKQIGADRLEFRPTSTRCVNCKSLGR